MTYTDGYKPPDKPPGHDWLFCDRGDCDKCAEKRAALFDRMDDAKAAREIIKRSRANFDAARIIGNYLASLQGPQIVGPSPEADAEIARIRRLLAAAPPPMLTSEQIATWQTRLWERDCVDGVADRDDRNVFTRHDLIMVEVRAVENSWVEWMFGKVTDKDTVIAPDALLIERRLNSLVDPPGSAPRPPSNDAIRRRLQRDLLESCPSSDLGNLRRIVVGRISKADRAARVELDAALWVWTRGDRAAAVPAFMAILALETRAPIDRAIRRHHLATKRSKGAC
jgi:hypothetical protein